VYPPGAGGGKGAPGARLRARARVAPASGLRPALAFRVVVPGAGC